jgi:hypothetical protein
MQLFGCELAGALNGARPETLYDVPGLAETRGVRWSHFGPQGISPIELVVNERFDVNLVDREILNVTRDGDVNEVDVLHNDSAEIGVGKLGVAQVDATKSGSPKVGLIKFRHVKTLDRT